MESDPVYALTKGQLFFSVNSTSTPGGGGGVKGLRNVESHSTLGGGGGVGGTSTVASTDLIKRHALSQQGTESSKPAAVRIQSSEPGEESARLAEQTQI